MARNDIRPFGSRDGSYRLRAFPLLILQDIAQGEPVSLSGGALSEAGSDAPTVVGICAVPTVRRTGEGIATAVTATGTLIQVYDTHGNQSFVTRNFATDGAGTPATPTQANAIGALAGLISVGGSWFLDTGATNLICEIEQILTNDGRPIAGPGATGLTGTQVVFRFIQ